MHFAIIFLIEAEVFGGKYFFNCVKEGDNVTFATDDENERTLWVQAIYRATGQTHKPVPPVVQTNKISNTQISRMQGGRRNFWRGSLQHFMFMRDRNGKISYL